MDISSGDFVWNAEKEAANIEKHGVDFVTAAKAFADPRRRTFHDDKHSGKEPRQFCIGMADGKVITVRYVLRQGKIRIFGAGFWRKGEAYYEAQD